MFRNSKPFKVKAKIKKIVNNLLFKIINIDVIIRSLLMYNNFTNIYRLLTKLCTSEFHFEEILTNLRLYTLTLEYLINYLY